MKYDVLVIGAGAAGLLAAGTAAAYGAKTVCIEKNEKPGKKLSITGKGRCNVTNAAEIRDFMEAIPVNPRFLYSAFSAFDNRDIIALLSRFGVETKTERGGRVFPVSDKAADVVSALARYASEGDCDRLRACVKKLIVKDDAVCGVLLSDGKTIFADRVILATGGASYPQTGSTGDGYRFAADCGHHVVCPKPSLVPLLTKESFVFKLMGLSLRNCAIRITNAKAKEIYRDFGEMLFTHYGVSGPMILSASAHLRDFSAPYHLEIDLKPALSEAALDKRILRDFSAAANKDFANSLGGLLPKKMIPPVIRLSGIAPQKKIHDITKEERLSLVRLLKAFPLTLVGTRPIAEAIVTSGGVDVKEIQPKTMESKKVKGLYFAGEVMDVDAYTGGYNLQIAFSTGYLAGMSAALSVGE